MAFIYISFVPEKLAAGIWHLGPCTPFLSFGYVTLRFACKQLAELRAFFHTYSMYYLSIYMYISG